MMCSITTTFLNGQITIAFQGFEGSASDTWNFTPPFQNTNLPRVDVGAGNYGPGYALTGINSMRIGGGSTTCGAGGSNCLNGSSNGGQCTNNNNGATLDLQSISIQCYRNVQVSVAYRTHILCATEGQGFDASDRIFFELSLDGAPFFIASNVNGFNNCTWNYTDASVLCAGPAVQNPFVYSVPLGTNSVALRIRLQVNRSDEVLYIDDITLTGEKSGGFSYPSPLCLNSLNSESPVLDATLNPGGTFSTFPVSGLFLNPTSGIIIPSQSDEGIYQVNYEISNEICATSSVTIQGNIITTPIYHD